jgi:ABC-type multidrug transport system fused ATPase/permease subunit
MASGRVVRRSARLLVGSSPGAAVALVGAQVLEGLAPAVVVAAGAALVDNAPAAGPSSGARSATATALVVIAVALAVGRVANAFVSMLGYVVGHRVGAAVDRLRMEAVTRLPGLAHFDQPDLASSLQASQWAFEAGRIVMYVGYFLRWASQAGGSAVVAARIGWWAPAVLALTVLPGAVVGWRHTGAQKALRLEQMASFRHAGYGAELAVGLEPAREVRLFGLRGWLISRQAGRWSGAMGPVMADMNRQLFHTLAVVAVKMAVTAVPFVVAYRRFSAGDLSAGDFSAAVVALSTVLFTMRWLEAFPADARAAAQFLPELFRLVDLPDADPRLIGGGSTRPPTAASTGIRFEGVRFTYPGTDRPVLDGLDLWLPAGSSLALVGENGAGKSTVVKLLCRFYDPDVGRITLDGTDLRDFDLREWRRRMAVVFQDFTHFPMPVADNVGVGCVERIDDRRLLETAAVQANADEVVARLPEGWETVLAQDLGGVDLSGGEWQRVALARAMTARLGRDASVLVLDEPTAALDVRLEHDLYERFARLTQGLTTLLVSHRFSTVRMADRVAVLEAGRMIENGTHDELVVSGGRYAELYQLQARRFA